MSVERATALLAAARPAPPPKLCSLTFVLLRAPRARRCAELDLDAGALALFRDCPRRYQLQRLLGFEEPTAVGQLDLFSALAPPEPFVDLPPPVAVSPDELPRARSRAPHRVLSRWPPERWGQPTQAQDVAMRLVAEGLPPGEAETARLAHALARFLEGPYARAAASATIAEGSAWCSAWRTRAFAAPGADSLRHRRACDAW